jgi:hypothetical protein
MKQKIRESGKNLSFQDMIRGQILKAAFIGAIIVLLLVTVLGLILGYLFMPAVITTDMIYFILVLVISSFIAGFITVYLIMNMAIKQLIATFMPAAKPEKPEKPEKKK